MPVMRPKGGNTKRKQCIPLCVAGLNIKTIMSKLFLSAMMVLLSLSALAQFSITGSVKEAKTSHTLEGATIQLDGTTLAAVSDDLGRFRFDGLKEGSYTVRVKFVGFTEKIESVE